MLTGKTCRVMLLCENAFMNSIIDRFGEDVPTQIVDENHFTVEATVNLSSNFYGWVFTSGGKMIITAPQGSVGGLLYELESKCRLIERKRQGLGKPNLIYVKNFVDNSADSSLPSPESRFQNRENHDSGQVKITDQESLKSRCSNTDKNNTDFSDTDSFPFTSFREDHGREPKGNEAALRERYRELIAENIAYDALRTDHPYEQDTLEEILELLVDVVCTTRSTVRISGDDKPAEVVRSQFLKLNSEHIRFVLDGLKENTTRIRNMRQYLLATLYNAPLTIGNYYRSLVSHDMSEGFI